MNIKQNIIIAPYLALILVLIGCSHSISNGNSKQNKEPDFISDQYGFKIFNLDGYSVDEGEAVLARNVLSLKKDNVKVRFGYFKGAKVNLALMGVSDSSDRQLLFEWVMNSVQLPQFYPGLEKVLLKWEYSKIAGSDSIVTDILLEKTKEFEEDDKSKIIKLRKSDKALFDEHPRILLRSYIFYRGDDLFSIEFLADPLTYHSEITNFEKTIISSLTLLPKGN